MEKENGPETTPGKRLMGVRIVREHQAAQRQTEGA